MVHWLAEMTEFCWVAPLAVCLAVLMVVWLVVMLAELWAEKLAGC